MYTLLLPFVLVMTTAASDPAFIRHVVDDTFTNGYQVTTADIDGDKREDIVALSTDPPRLVWYRNPDWQRFTITSRTRQNIDAAAYDIDGDGRLDLALASGFELNAATSAGTIEWLACPKDPGMEQEWPRYRIDAIPTAHRVRWADLDGDGRKELQVLPIIGAGASAPEYKGGVQFRAYAIPKDPRQNPWPGVDIDTTLEMAHAMRVVRWNDEARDSVLTASFGGVHLFHRKNATQFSMQHICAGHNGARPTQGSSEVALGRMGNARYIATIEPWHGNEVVVYTPTVDPASLWNRSIIDTTLVDGHALACSDLDGDGNDEVVAGHRGKGHNLYGYRRNAEESKWQRFPIDEGGISAAGIAIADLNGDGRPDIVATGTATKNVVWYETIPGT